MAHLESETFQYLRMEVTIFLYLQDDTKVVLSKPEVITMVETVQKQQQQFSDLPEHIPLDPHIPITFTKVSILIDSLTEMKFGWLRL